VRWVPLGLQASANNKTTIVNKVIVLVFGFILRLSPGVDGQA
jgi:hypothetical protein